MAVALNKHIKEPFNLCPKCSEELASFSKKKPEPIFQTIECGISFSVFEKDGSFSIMAGNTEFPTIYSDLKECKQLISAFANRQIFYA